MSQTKKEHSERSVFEEILSKGARVIKAPAGELVEDCLYMWSASDDGVEYDYYIEPPYYDPSFTYTYSDDPLIEEAQRVAETESLDPQHPTGVVLVAGDEIIGFGANGSDYHEKHGCRRKELGIPTGQRYDLCEGCSNENHAEIKAIKRAISEGNVDKLGSDVTAYLYGHWWLCEPCSNQLRTHNISNIVLSKGWTKDFLGI